MFVYEPSIATYHDLISTLKITPLLHSLSRTIVSDKENFVPQDFLNMYFTDIFKLIPPVNNLVLAMLWRHPENVELEKVKLVHYCAARKLYNH
ncbi:hypothetical protein Droror1_Dr00011125 [Drosera rotundifolia]